MVGGDNCGLVQSGCSRGDEKYLDYAYILKVQLAEFAYILDVCWERKKAMMTPTFYSEQPCENVHFCCCLVTKLCPTLFATPPGSAVHGITQARIQVGCHFHLQGIFPTQGLKLSPALEVDSLPLSH